MGQQGFHLEWQTVEGEEDSAEEGCRLLVWVGSELGLDVNDEGQTDCGEQTRLREKVRSYDTRKQMIDNERK